MKTSEQRSQRNDFDAFEREIAELACRTNANVEWHIDQRFENGPFSVHATDGNSRENWILVFCQKIGVQFSQFHFAHLHTQHRWLLRLSTALLPHPKTLLNAEKRIAVVTSSPFGLPVRRADLQQIEIQLFCQKIVIPFSAKCSACMHTTQ